MSNLTNQKRVVKDLIHFKRKWITDLGENSNPVEFAAMKLILLFVLLVACKALSIKSSVEKSRFRCSLMRLPNRHRMYVDSGSKGDGGLDTTRDRDSYREVDFPLPLSDMSNGLLTMNVLGQIDFCLRTVDNR